MKFTQGCCTKHSPNGLSQHKQPQSVESMPMKSIKDMRDGAGTGAESVISTRRSYTDLRIQLE